MTNLPPPEPRSSRIGLDELIGIVVAFTTIGAILLVTLSQRDKVFNLSRFITSSATDKTSAVNKTTEATEQPAPAVPRPSVTPEETPSPQPKAIAFSKSPSFSTSPTPITSLPAGTPKREPTTVPLPVPSAPRAEAATETSPTTNVQTVNFKDVPEDSWARPYIDTLATRGIMRGFQDGSFKPGSSVTRAEFAALLQKAFKQEPLLKATTFKDVSADFWASPAIQESTKIGFLRGYPGDIFQPQQKISRVQVLVALASGLGLTPTGASKEFLQTYQDAGQIPNYAKQQVSAATKAGLVVNYPNPKLLNPNRDATRAEVAAFVYQALVEAGKVEPIPSKYVVQP